MTDKFKNYSANLTSPYESAMTVTPNDIEDLPFVSRALHIPANCIGNTYRVRVTMLSGQEVDLNLEAGKFHQLRVKKIHQTGTHPLTDGSFGEIPIVVLW